MDVVKLLFEILTSYIFSLDRLSKCEWSQSNNRKEDYKGIEKSGVKNKDCLTR